ncbi:MULTISPECIES: 16S rRNA (uracil(1498)-N(3))-methyltransferase [unclassified Synechococcus]|uniref:16S rRNA (uracil(1498)-N(3))-methyltransferase n=1 Tax=unclassified Synechococcus TaxID=2626047 RepID=UPI0021A44960|nr:MULTISPECIES: 16S rRNA (uracil(1498)-N(3))-methyltransferase [unclassified Synechococcus]MCT0213690.1 16S rRNA (uracil(1498)-N(3))-methyltransferase [Synechococcus sp. CS-1326]MCT0234093.1 16S rRNA (uracil(1498)-N(3))-methyltransferase [Synechococcus sp. CS-1327]
MARELRRLLIDPGRLADRLALTAEESRYLTRSLRYRPGDRFAVTDGAGRLWSAVLLDPRTAELQQPRQHPLEVEPAARPCLCLALAVPRLDGDVVIRMACELGVDQLQPLLAARSSPGAERRRGRWPAILREAGEQSERLWQPELGELVEAGSWLARPVEGLALIATTRRPDLPLLGSLLAGTSAGEAPEALALAIGPEGGWTPQEEQLAGQSGWRAVSLGPRILRCSTAAVAGLSLLSQWRSSRHGC